MPSECERFWDRDAYAVVGRQGSKRGFPKLTYRALKDRGKTVYAIDPGSGEVQGDTAYPDFATLPHKTLVRIDNSRHFIMLDQPAAFAAQVDRFLQAAAPADSTGSK